MNMNVGSTLVSMEALVTIFEIEIIPKASF